MSLISKIREKTGFVIGAVAIGLGMFVVGGDLLGPNSGFFGGRDNTVGEIAGETITYEEYQQTIQEVESNYTLQTGNQPSASQQFGIRQQAWDKLIADIAFQQQYEALGLEVTEEEVVDMVQGNNISPQLKQAFVDSTGNFNRNLIVNYLKNLSQLPPQQQAAWYNFERSLGPSRLRIKFENLISKATFVTQAEARRQYREQNTTASIKYYFIPSYTLADSLVTVSETEMENFLEDHKEDYEVEAGRTLKYITIPIIPAPEDTARLQEEIDRLVPRFQQASNDSAFAAINSDGNEPYRSYRIDELPAQLAGNPDQLQEGQVYGPFQQQGNYVMLKVSGITESDTYSARASHILLKTGEGQNDAAQRSKAQRLLREIRNGADFATYARTYSDDPSAQRGGDLGWFSEGRMVAPFEEAVFNRSSVGLVNRVVKSQFGYHIIKVTQPKTNISYEIARIQREVFPSDQTRNMAFRKADLFASQVSDPSSFQKQAEADSLEIMVAENVAKDARNLRLMNNSRQVIRWAYNEADVGDVSPVYELEENYIVALLTGKREKGTASLESVKDEIRSKVRDRKKAERIAEKARELEGTIEEMAAAYGADAEVFTMDALKLSASSITSVGKAPEAVGAVFGTPAGEMTGPITLDNGVVNIEVLSKTEAPEIADYSTYKDAVAERMARQATTKINEAVRDNAKIVDQRYKFF
mgnify:CR=1 FL=1